MGGGGLLSLLCQTRRELHSVGVTASELGTAPSQRLSDPLLLTCTPCRDCCPSAVLNQQGTLQTLLKVLDLGDISISHW